MTSKKWLVTKCHNCKNAVEEKDAFIIDEEKDLIFCSEKCLYEHFANPIGELEKEYMAHRGDDDISQEEFSKYEDCLNTLLEEPSEIWEDTETVKGTPLHQYIGEFSVDDQSIYYIAIVTQTQSAPNFVFLHFPTTDLKLVEHYRRGRLIYDKSQSEIEIEASEGDALSEGDEMAQNLFQAMIGVRSNKDIPEDEFAKYIHLRQEAIEEADEIWRKSDLQGNTLVHFIKEFSLDEGDVKYVVVTIQDVMSGSHFILFSFPTKDEQLVERYRQGHSLNSETDTPDETH
ncbi:MAG: PBECR2 nuclease fold domain-containing protein [Bdellovibrionales bacterium]